MKITSKTKYADFREYEPFITDESKAELKRQAEQAFKPCHLLTLDEFWAISTKDYTLLGSLEEPTVLQVYWLLRFADYCEELRKICERLTIEQTGDEVQAEQGCVTLSPQESMLVFVRSYFGLRSFREAGQVTMNEYILARKDKYNHARQQRNWENMQRNRMKRK